MKRLYPLFLAAVFLFGCLGHLLLQPKKEAGPPAVLSFSAENVNNLLLYSFPAEGTTLTLLGTECTLLEISHSGTILRARQGGRETARTSLLFSTVSIRVKAEVREKEGRLFVGEAPLFWGDTVTLLGENFSFSARFAGSRWDFS